MEKHDNSIASLIPYKPERKVIEKNRRSQMKVLYSQLLSLLPNTLTSKGSFQISEKVDEAILYIESLKTTLQKSKIKKQKLLTRKRLHEHTGNDSHRASASQSLVVQIYEMSPDADVILVTGLKIHSVFYDILRVLDQCSTEVVHANFSASGASTFHVQQKKIEAAEMYRRLNDLFERSSKAEELNNHTPYAKEEEGNLDLWDFEICSDILFMNT